MLIYFLSLMLLTAGITYGALYYIVPENHLTPPKPLHAQKTVFISPTNSIDSEVLPPTQSAEVMGTLATTPSHLQHTTQLPPTATTTPIPTVAMQNTVTQGLDASLLYSLVNDYRTEYGLPPFQKDETTCAIAYNRSAEVYDEIWVSHNMHAGLYAMHLPYWITENIINYSTEEGAFNWWISDATHRNVILGNYTYSCTACYGYSCSQVFTSYVQK